ncbi:MAG: hypothetical protein J07HQW2_00303 [Haloquadratum walsbyi J07HQW2]|jgi:hypothetical protein|uniref:Uncharacterized protein n=1 Tax=Haloquadratum walsbyi J07HQW2 TaxID=1238425 RepID=U1MUA1_9EURY|nr:MAG: hypothetical protein J07HQW2_00303 [Haloquadratum walsbyi J07HQW2]
MSIGKWKMKVDHNSIRHSKHHELQTPSKKAELDYDVYIDDNAKLLGITLEFYQVLGMLSYL